MEQELRDAIALYESSLADLATDQNDQADDDEELQQLRQQLHTALDETRSALAALLAEHQPSTSAPSQQPQRGGYTSNAGIHPNNQYAHQEPDFALLAEQYPSLQPHLIVGKDYNARPSIDFTSYNASRELTRVLLHHDFGITWDVPDGQLVPPVTNRANYIHWLDDLLTLSRHRRNAIATGGESVLGLDIGCGANLIYPLLGTALYRWRFVAVDVTDVAIEWAEKNRQANPHLAQLITIRRALPQPPQADIVCAVNIGNGTRTTTTTSKGILSSAIQEEGQTAFDFCMCNPPFFETMEEAGQNPSTAFAGTPAEMVYPAPGGELAFVTNMVEDSFVLKQQIHWYTTMVGKKSTMKAIRTLLYSKGVKVVRTTEFCQGKTSRWAIAWSFAARPDVANKPIIRRRQQQLATQHHQQQERIATAPSAAGVSSTKPGMLSITVSKVTSAIDLLHTAESILTQHGFKCTVDTGAFSIHASISVNDAHDDAAKEEEAVHATKKQRVVESTEQAPPSALATVQLFMQNAKTVNLVVKLVLNNKAPPAQPVLITRYNQALRDIKTALASR